MWDGRCGQTVAPWHNNANPGGRGQRPKTNGTLTSGLLSLAVGAFILKAWLMPGSVLESEGEDSVPSLYER